MIIFSNLKTQQCCTAYEMDIHVCQLSATIRNLCPETITYIYIYMYIHIYSHICINTHTYPRAHQSTHIIIKSIYQHDHSAQYDCV